ncbi:MAG: biotin--[acetyl-CoA-carboxylase] ligase, partial [Guyparkeria sp.]|uniref:biotin--[acetyl-CoA-carboxylase] ligase n=1 Tax=Guyparkeria sp. TaxID=2035736 RepID=UPI003978FC77
LRPGLPAAECAELGPVACVALGRALGPLVTPMTELHYRWPNDVLLNGGKVAGIWLDAGGPAEALDWLALSWALNLTAVPAGLAGEAAALAGEGRNDAIDGGELFRAIVRELLTAIMAWDESGFTPLLRSWRNRMPEQESVSIRIDAGPGVSGTPQGVDDAGGLTLATADGTRRLSLLDFFLAGADDQEGYHDG